MRCSVLETHGRIGSWKCYPAWSPANSEAVANDGWFLDDPAVGVPFIEQRIALGVPLFCIHEGLPIPAFSTQHLDPADVGRIAKRYPEAKFVVYHSGYGNGNNYFEQGYRRQPQRHRQPRHLADRGWRRAQRERVRRARHHWRLLEQSQFKPG